GPRASGAWNAQRRRRRPQAARRSRRSLPKRSGGQDQSRSAAGLGHDPEQSGNALAALANKMEPQAAAEIAKGLAAALENPQETASARLSAFGQSLAAVCRLLPSTHRTHLLALSNMLRQPVSEDAAEGEEQSYDRKLLAEVCTQLRTEDLAEVLKYPFCT